MTVYYCPICKTQIEVKEKPEKCNNCGWTYIPPAYSKQKGWFQSGKNNSDDTIENLRENWAREKWQELQNLSQKLSQKLNQKSGQDSLTLSSPNPTKIIENSSPLDKSDTSSNLDENKIKQFKQLINQEIQEILPNLLSKSLSNLLENNPDILHDFVYQKIESFMAENYEINNADINQDQISAMDSIDNSLNTSSQSYNDNYYPIEYNQINREDEQPQLNINLTPVEEELIIKYNNSNVNFNYTNVTLTQESFLKIRQGIEPSILFERDKRGEYWIISMNNNIYLVPQLNLRLNSYAIKTIKLLFQCNGVGEESKIFHLIKPAKVAMVEENKWRFVEQGILQF
jgi:hypothetical protein